MVLVAGYLVTTQPSFFSSPPLQPIHPLPLRPLATFPFVFSPLNGKLISTSCVLPVCLTSVLLCALLSFLPPSLHPSFHVASTQHLRAPPNPFLSSLHPSLAPRRPLIFMRLAGAPRSASLSPSEREEAADCQRLMDFWKTQTAMHHSLQNRGGGRFGVKPEAGGEERKTSEGQAGSQESVEVGGKS